LAFGKYLHDIPLCNPIEFFVPAEARAYEQSIDTPSNDLHDGIQAADRLPSAANVASRHIDVLCARSTDFINDIGEHWVQRSVELILDDSMVPGFPNSSMPHGIVKLERLLKGGKESISLYHN
jgi:hypothetical protein